MDANAIESLIKELVQMVSSGTDQAFDIKRDEMLTMDEVCGRLKVHRNTLSAWIKAGKFPQSVSVCGVKRWSSSSINTNVYEENPHLREREHLLAEARRISCSTPKQRSVAE